MIENRIRELREQNHMSQLNLAMKLGVAQETISAYENGRNAPSVESLIALSQILNASCDYILGLSDVRKPINPHSLSEHEQLILQIFRSLSEIDRIRIHAYIDGLMEV